MLLISSCNTKPSLYAACVTTETIIECVVAADNGEEIMEKRKMRMKMTMERLHKLRLGEKDDKEEVELTHLFITVEKNENVKVTRAHNITLTFLVWLFRVRVLRLDSLVLRVSMIKRSLCLSVLICLLRLVSLRSLLPLSVFSHLLFTSLTPAMNQLRLSLHCVPLLHLNN